MRSATWMPYLNYLTGTELDVRTMRRCSTFTGPRRQYFGPTSFDSMGLAVMSFSSRDRYSCQCFSIITALPWRGTGHADYQPPRR